jgi:outer membrane receptor for ferrienterochelin and colicins
MKNYLSVVVLSLIVFFAQAQDQLGSVSGKVYSKDGPASYATVGLEGTTFGGITDTEGYFKVQNIPIGSYKLKVSSTGFRTYSVDIEVKPNSASNFEIQLTEDLLNLEDVVVSGTRYEYDRSNAPVVVNVLDKKI